MDLIYGLIGLLPMVILIASIVFGFYYSITTLFTSTDKMSKSYKHHRNRLIISIFVIVFSVGGFIWYKSYAHLEQKLLYKANISAVEDISQVNGSGNYMRYYVTTDEYYKIIKDFGSYKTQAKIPSDYTRIIEDGKCQLYVYEQTSGYKIIDMYFKYYQKPNLYELHIPKNSVTNKYNIDLK